MLVTDVIVKSKGTAFSIAHKFQQGEKIAFRQEGDKDVFLVDTVLVSNDGNSVYVDGTWLDAENDYEFGGEWDNEFDSRDAIFVSFVEVVKREPRNWTECLPAEYNNGTYAWTEEVVWDAIAEFHGVDVSEIADGDLASYL
jgi:hypothetical protein